MNTKCIWTVCGANWEWARAGRIEDNVTELATIAIQEVMGNTANMTGRLTMDENAEKNDDLPEVGIAMMVRNDQMKSENEHLFAFSAPLLADAGLHAAAAQVAAAQKAMEAGE